MSRSQLIATEQTNDNENDILNDILKKLGQFFITAPD